MVKYKGNNLYEVERTEGWWFWKTTYVARAYGYEPEIGIGGWYWADDDSEIRESDVRIALSEAFQKHARVVEADKWRKK